MHHEMDACVVGAGVAGAATALLLARHGMRVALVDRSAPVRQFHPGHVGVELQLDADADRRPEGRRLRVPDDAWRAGSRSFEVLPPLAVHAMAAMGAGDVRTLGGACRGVLSRWSGEAPAFTDYELLGCAAGRAVTRGAVARCLTAHAVRAGARVIEAGFVDGRRSRDGWTLTSVDRSQSGAGISCRHVIDATGRSGRTIAALSPRCHHDRAVCLSTRHAAPLDDPTLLLVDRSSHGWWYAVAGSEGGTDVAFVTDADLLPHARDRARWLTAEFREATLIASQLAGRPGFETLTSRDARSGHRACAGGEGWLAVGDAALSWDPLSGHGIRFAIESAERAAEAVLGAGGDRRYPAYVRWCEDAVKDYQSARTAMYGAASAASSGSAFWLRRCAHGSGRQVPQP